MTRHALLRATLAVALTTTATALHFKVKIQRFFGGSVRTVLPHAE